MNYLLDTHLLIWAATDSIKLSKNARQIIEDPDHTLWVSVASLWEVAIKRSKLRTEFPFEVGPLREAVSAGGYEEIAIEARHTLIVQDLPRFHTDPFDRLLVAQAIAEGMTLITADRALAAYGASVRVV